MAMVTLCIHGNSLRKYYIVHLLLYFTGTGDALKLMAELLRIFIAGTCKLQTILYLTIILRNLWPRRLKSDDIPRD